MPTARSGEGALLTRSRVLPGVVRTLLASLACALALSCAGGAPRQAALGDEVAVGPYTFVVVDARPAPDPAPPLNVFRDEPGKKAVIVSIRWRSLPGGLDGASRVSVIEGVLRNQLWVSDAAGKRVRPDGEIPESLARWQGAAPDLDAWAVVFYVAEGSRELSLIVENPEPREGQARVTTVRLGM